jgi:hypothetical protein
MMDEKYPNTLQGEGKNCYIKILEHYNNYYKTDAMLNKLQDKKINLCSAFMTTTDNFIDLAGFLRYAIESRYLDKFDSHHRYRFQGGMMERYIGIYSALRIHNFETIELKHHALTTISNVRRSANWAARCIAIAKRLLWTV